MDLNSFLWYQLCTAGCQGIYFVSGTADSCTVESKDAHSFQSFENRTQGFFKSLFGTNARPYTPETRMTRLKDKDYQAFLKWIPEQLKQEDQAFVIPLDTFCAMVRGIGGEAFLNRMTALNDRQTHGRLVLTTEQDVPKITALLHEPLFEPFPYQDAVFLNQYDRQQLTALVRSAQNHAAVLPLPEDTQAAMAEYLDCWAHADSVRRQDQVFGTQKLFSYRELLSWLEQESNWKTLARCALQFRENGGRHAVKDYQVRR